VSLALLPGIPPTFSYPQELCVLRHHRSIGLVLPLALFAARSASAATITVNAGEDLQAKIDAAKPGDTIMLQAGATFTGSYKLRAKPGATRYITIRSSAANASLPAAGERMTPAYASLLPKIRASSSLGPAMKTDPGATYWRLLFLEFLPVPSTAAVNLVAFGGTGSSQNTLSAVPQNLMIDRCYLHGDPSYGSRRGLALNSGSTQVVGSYFADFKGKNQDTQAIMGWNGPGPYLIENNYLEAAAENLLFGGNDPSIPNLIPSDIVIRRNLITKKTAWMSQSWTVKNLIELKNAQRVLIEGNTIENNWAAGQQGYAIVFTPRNQNGTAPWSVVRDIAVQSNIIRHVAAAFTICGYDDLATSQQTQNITIKNNLFYDVNTWWKAPNQNANGWLAVIGGGPKNIEIDHNTVDNNGSTIILLYGGYAPTGKSILGFEVTNNLLRDNSYGISGSGTQEGTASLTAYAPNAVVLNNAFGGGQIKLYPTGNFFPTLAQWLADFVNPGAGDYRLKSTRGMGVDFKALNAAMSTATATASAPAPAPAPTGSTPYTGTPVALPGTVQFENYDAGGSGIAFYDTTSGNTGNVYRSNNVDIQATTDSGGGYHLGWVKASEWLNYTVSIGETRTYAIDVRVASNGAGGTFHIEVDGVNKTGPITIPDTGGWLTWRTITTSGVSLTSGTHVFRVVMDTNGANGWVGNLNWLAVN
jgi:hypothetical protein